MPPKKEKEVPFEDQLTDAVQSLEGFAVEGAFYDRDALSGSHAAVIDLADQGFKVGQLDQPKSIEVKLAATRSAKEIALSRGDQIKAVDLGHLEQTYETLLSVIQPPESPEPAEPAATSKAKSGAAKSPTDT